jgi:hypothetical protein
MIVRTMWGKEFRSLRLCRRQLVYQTARISSEIASTPSTSSMYVKPLQIVLQHDLITDDAGLIDARRRFLFMSPLAAGGCRGRSARAGAGRGFVENR